MPFLFFIIGLALVVAAIRSSHNDLFTALTHDIPGFAVWALAIVAIGAIGYIPQLRTPSRALLVLVIVVVFIKYNQQIFSNLPNAFNATDTKPATTGGAENATPLGPVPVQVTGAGGSSSGGGPLGAVSSGLSAVKSVGSFLGFL